eukprot:TRINITY_DN5618_c0_g1_i2.p1 TRINITY_DN5618_c0_g1~~TRINITY_DN5618_c0_g1_i2.p1  ORF type:complete len:449 (-),score=187.85 TRINITY_DN5618_c0_g1_i2:98-1444(-)
MSNNTNTPLSESDPVLSNLLREEQQRQLNGLEMIASENFTSRAVMECLGSCATNKYSEGLPGKRYYGGNEIIDKIETLCQERALDLYNLDPEEWGVNVQPYSGSVANFAAYAGIIKPHDRIMGLDLTCGGHLTHGFQKGNKKVSHTALYFESLSYTVDEEGFIDYDELEKLAMKFYPKLIICGFSAYPRDLDYARFRDIANKCKAFLLADMAHISGLVAAGEANNPFEYCDVVTSTTHKTLRGPRSGIIFCKRDLLTGINESVFPGLQGGPHENQIAAVATALHQAKQPEFKEYIQQVKKNAQHLANKMMERGYTLTTNGTENHLIVWNVRKLGLSGSKMEKILEDISISVNKNTVPGDKSALFPGGIRIGTPALTSRGMKEEHMETIIEFYTRAVNISLEAQELAGSKTFKAFLPALEIESIKTQITTLKQEVEEFASQFPMPGYSD